MTPSPRHEASQAYAAWKAIAGLAEVMHYAAVLLWLTAACLVIDWVTRSVPWPQPGITATTVFAVAVLAPATFGLAAILMLRRQLDASLWLAVAFDEATRRAEDAERRLAADAPPGTTGPPPA